MDLTFGEQIQGFYRRIAILAKAASEGRADKALLDRLWGRCWPIYRQIMQSEYDSPLRSWRSSLGVYRQARLVVAGNLGESPSVYVDTIHDRLRGHVGWLSWHDAAFALALFDAWTFQKSGMEGAAPFDTWRHAEPPDLNWRPVRDATLLSHVPDRHRVQNELRWEQSAAQGLSQGEPPALPAASAAIGGGTLGNPVDRLPATGESSPTAAHGAHDAHKTKLFPRGLPRDPELYGAILYLETNRGQGKSDIDILRDFTSEKAGSDRRAKALQARIRAARSRGATTLPPRQ